MIVIVLFLISLIGTMYTYVFIVQDIPLEHHMKLYLPKNMTTVRRTANSKGSVYESSAQLPPRKSDHIF